MEAFLRDESPGGYEQLVDRLLASPHYGERMAQYWLDLVRYADSIGYHSDNSRDVWLYRDYVIAAFNGNKPFDRFTREQLAGDLLPEVSDETRLASGYNRLLQTTEEGGAQAKEYTAKYAADRVRNLASVWLASTMGCAECHNHKFDPFTTRAVLQPAGFLRRRQRETDLAARRNAFPLARSGQANRRLRRPNRRCPQEARHANSRARRGVGPLGSGAGESQRRLGDAQADQRGFVGRQQIEDSRRRLDPGRRQGRNPRCPRCLYHRSVDRQDRSDRPAVGSPVRPSLPANGPGRAANGNFVLSELHVAAVPVADPQAKAIAVALENASADFEQNGSFACRRAIDGNPEHRLGDLPQAGKNHLAIFELKETLETGRGALLWITLEQNFGSGHAIGRFALAATNSSGPLRVTSGLPGPIAAILAVPAADRTPEQRKQFAAHYRSIAPELAGDRTHLAELEKAKGRVDQRRAQVAGRRSAVTPRTIRVLPRGNWLSDDGEIVEPLVPTFIAPLGSRRSPADAAWIWPIGSSRRDNPLTARVLVNRLWKLTFGQGLVKSLEDFGSQGDSPTHPRAARLAGRRIDRQRLGRQTDDEADCRCPTPIGRVRPPRPTQREHDPENKLARPARAVPPRSRRGARQALAISGLLVA